MNVVPITGLKKISILPHICDGLWNGNDWIVISEAQIVINGRLHIIRPGFVTDFGSIPRVARSSIDRMGKMLAAFLWHDYFYTKDSPLTRKQADDVMFELGKMYGESWWTLRKVYYAVRTFGGFASMKENVFEKIDTNVIDHICRSNNYYPKSPENKKNI